MSVTSTANTFRLTIVGSLAAFSLAAPGRGDVQPSLDDLRRYVTEQPRTFDNEIFFKRIDGEIVRSDHFVGAGSGVFADFDGDGDVDLIDYSAFEICMNASGPGAGIPPACAVFDSEPDSDVDLVDYSALEIGFTGPLSMVMVEAGALVPARSSLSSYSSGTPGTAGNNALNGTAAQAGYTQDDLWYQWTVDAKPAGSGDIVISNSSLAATAYTILPPAVPGTYTFRLLVTNLITMESGSDTVSLELLDVPTVTVTLGFVPTRFHLVRGSTTGRDVNVTYSSHSAGFIDFFDGRATNNSNDLITALPIVDTSGANTNGTVALPALGNRQTLTPRRYAINTQITDSVGLTPGDTVVVNGFFGDDAALTDPTGSEVNERPLNLYTSVPFTDAATPANGGLPAITNMTNEVGETFGAGTGVGQVAHSGIGDGTPALTQVSGQSVIAGQDFNRDGFDDFAVLGTAARVDVFFGHPGMNTDYAAAGTGDDWPAQPPATANRGEAVVVANAIAVCSGDVTGDGNPDLAVIENAGGAFTRLNVIFGQGSSPLTPFANAATAGQFRQYYPLTVATDFLNATCAVGDVTGDGVDDIIVGAPNFDPDAAAGVGAPGEGGIFVIYGSSSLPASGTALGTVAAAPTGRTIPGVNGAPLEQRGRVLHIGDFDGSGAMDLAAAFGNQVIAGIEIFIGASLFPSAPTSVYNLAIAGDMIGGSLYLADMDGFPGVDVLVGAANANGGTGRFSVIPNGMPDNTVLNSALTLDYTAVPGAGLGSALNVFDWNGDGTMDVLIGASNGGFVEVVHGPVTGDFIAATVNQRLTTFGAACDQILWADVNADGNNDVIVTDPNADTAYCMFGLD